MARALKRKREEKEERKEMEKKERFLEDFLFGAKVLYYYKITINSDQHDHSFMLFITEN